MRHLQHPALKRKCRAAEQIDHAAAVLRINVFQIQQNAFAAKQIFDDFPTFFNLANVDNSFAVRILQFLRGARVHSRIVNDIIMAGLTSNRGILFLIFFVLFRYDSSATRRGSLFFIFAKRIIQGETRRTLFVFLLVFVIFLCGGLAPARSGLLFALAKRIIQGKPRRTSVFFFLLVLFILNFAVLKLVVVAVVIAFVGNKAELFRQRVEKTPECVSPLRLFS